MPANINTSATPQRAEEHVILVNENDVPTGTSPKLEAHRRGLRHRAVSVIIRDGAGRVLLQQRAGAKYHSGGLWTNTCCGHPRPGESTAGAAVRRLREEMGIEAALSFLLRMQYRAEVSNELIENEIVHVFAGRFDGVPDLDPQEAAAWAWKTSAEITLGMAQHPEAYTPWFRVYCRDFWKEMTG
jgi:isopentenyl-diphosphate Delta-isomerase